MVEQGTTSAQRRVLSILSGLPSAIEAAALEPPALFAIGPTVGHAETLDWVTKLPLAGQRLLVPVSRAGFAVHLEAAGAEVVILPMPATPAARVVMGALPLTGCVVGTAAEVDWLDEERGGPGWGDEFVAWCVGSETAARARERGWSNVRELLIDCDENELVATIGG
jgi:hypothetical protein